ncbi:MAG: 2-oxopent-4-enoate hydratase, partial [SAR324 cluster bacterium]|nr:2-oxopent-4-enoate hydratase [SAR324 cluster bacterium]
MNNIKINDTAQILYEALKNRTVIAPLTDQYPDMSIEESYQISLALLDLRIASGERVIGKKIGVTSKAVQDMLNVRQPDFGFLTDKMAYSSGETLPVSTEMIQPK